MKNTIIRKQSSVKRCASLKEPDDLEGVVRWNTPNPNQKKTMLSKIDFVTSCSSTYMCGIMHLSSVSPTCVFQTSTDLCVSNQHGHTSSTFHDEQRNTFTENIHSPNNCPWHLRIWKPRTRFPNWRSMKIHPLEKFVMKQCATITKQIRWNFKGNKKKHVHNLGSQMVVRETWQRHSPNVNFLVSLFVKRCSSEYLVTE